MLLIRVVRAESAVWYASSIASSRASARVTSAAISAVSVASAATRAASSASMFCCSRVSAADAREDSVATASAISCATAVLARASVKYLDDVGVDPSTRSSVENDAMKSSAPIFLSESEPTSYNRVKQSAGFIIPCSSACPCTALSSSLVLITALSASAGDLICLNDIR